MVAAFRFLAKALWLVAVAAIVIGVGMIILNGGTWPDSLAPVQSLFQTLHGSFGPLAYIIQIALFAGPGALAMWLADYLEERQRRRPNSN